MNADEFYNKVIGKVMASLRDPSAKHSISEDVLQSLENQWKSKTLERCAVMPPSYGAMRPPPQRRGDLQLYPSYLPPRMFAGAFPRIPFDQYHLRPLPVDPRRGQHAPTGFGHAQNATYQWVRSMGSHKNDGNSGSEGDSESENEEDLKRDEGLFEKKHQTGADRKPDAEAHSLPSAPSSSVAILSSAGKRAQPIGGKPSAAELKLEEEKVKIKKEEKESEDLSDGDDSDQEEEPKDFDFMCGEYEKVQRTKNKAGNKFRCTFHNMILRATTGEFVFGLLNGEIEY